MAQRNRKFQTDTTISKYNRQKTKRDSVLHKWVPSSRCDDDDMRRFDLGFGSNNNNGWDVNDMFKRNEIEYGVKSTFDESLKGYTTEINRDASDFKELEAKAARLAREIQRNSISQKRAELENCDEEEIFTPGLRKTKSRNNKSQKPESQQLHSNVCNFQINQNNRHRNSKCPLNERQNFFSGSGTKNFHQNRRRYNQNYDILNASTPPQYLNKNNNRPSVVKHVSSAIVIDDDNNKPSLGFDNSHFESSDKRQESRPRNEQDLNERVGVPICITNTQELDTVMSCPKVESLIIVTPDICDSKSEPVPNSDDDKNNLKKISTGLNVTNIKIQDASRSSILPDTTHKEDYSLISDSEFCLPLQEFQEIVEHKDESLLLLNYDWEGTGNENSITNKKQENDLKQFFIDCHTTDLKIQNDVKNTSSMVVISEMLIHQSNQLFKFDSHRPTEEIKEPSELSNESCLDISSLTVNEPSNEKEEIIEISNEKSIPFKLNPLCKEFKPHNDPPKTCQLPPATCNAVMPIMVPVPVNFNFQNGNYQIYFQYVLQQNIAPFAIMQPRYLYGHSQFVIGFNNNFYQLFP